MTPHEEIEALKQKLKESENYNSKLVSLLMTLGSNLRDHAIMLRRDARMLQGLQSRVFKMADTLDHYAAGLLLGTLTKEKANEQAPSN